MLITPGSGSDAGFYVLVRGGLVSLRVYRPARTPRANPLKPTTTVLERSLSIILVNQIWPVSRKAPGAKLERTYEPTGERHWWTFLPFTDSNMENKFAVV
jgi:hypothetical protein